MNEREDDTKEERELQKEPLICNRYENLRARLRVGNFLWWFRPKKKKKRKNSLESLESTEKGKRKRWRRTSRRATRSLHRSRSIFPFRPRNTSEASNSRVIDACRGNRQAECREPDRKWVSEVASESQTWLTDSACRGSALACPTRYLYLCRWPAGSVYYFRGNYVFVPRPSFITGGSLIDNLRTAAQPDWGITLDQKYRHSDISQMYFDTLICLILYVFIIYV